ncbi:AAA family ATPase [Gimesia chilikensis]|uniref:ATPase RavA n=1 Tax=Gimesia chilikensis TaxID=2605989 RepID=A0A517PYT7_9PLAN|nr:MoxR family ATPase [Gimesia chilikensis]QDT24541.1 ATPase RavA [Gimesia chilikensis]
MEASDLEAVEKLHQAYERLLKEVNHVVIGQHKVVEELMISLLAGGHCLLVGVPGLAKTLIVHTLADTLNLSFNRVQFTPDLMPADITGTDVIQEDKITGNRDFKFLAGPVFANVVLADEINRTPPKTQAALLEAMQEHQVTAGGRKHKLPVPFFVLATQNPIEQEGTYPLPEAQLDRFMFEIKVEYPTEEEEFAIVRQTTSDESYAVKKVLELDELLSFQSLVRRVPVADHVIRYAMQFARMTRIIATDDARATDIPDFIREYVSWGAGPRASQNLVLGAKARAILHGRLYVSTDDVRAVAHPVLRHRIITNFNAEADGMSPDKIVDRLIELIPVDSSQEKLDGRLPQVFRSADAR